MIEDETLVVLAGLPKPQLCALPGQPYATMSSCSHFARYGDLLYLHGPRGQQNYCICCAAILLHSPGRSPIYNCDGSIYHDE